MLACQCFPIVPKLSEIWVPSAKTIHPYIRHVHSQSVTWLLARRLIRVIGGKLVRHIVEEMKKDAIVDNYSKSTKETLVSTEMYVHFYLIRANTYFFCF